MKLRYLDFQPAFGPGEDIADTAAVIGRVAAGARLTLRAHATLRADGEHIRVGDDVFFAERATVHIVDGMIGTKMGSGVAVGRYGVVHGCTLGDGVVVGEGAAVMDDASVGPNAVIAADSIVAPGKKLAGGWLYQGVPAQPVREVSGAEAAAVARSVRDGAPQPVLCSAVLPLLLTETFPGVASVPGRSTQAPTAYVAPTAHVTGEVRLGEDAGIYFGCVVAACDGRIAIGARSNVQDNSFLVTSRARGDLVLGAGITVGHNVQMGAGTFGDDCLVGMLSRVADGVTVEPGGCIAAGAWVDPGTVVEAGWIWAGRPARAFREVRPAEREEFARGRDVYVGYGTAYRAG